MTTIARRDFLKHSFAATAFAAVAGEFSCIEFADAAPIQVPVVDKLSIRVLVDSSHDQFLKPITVRASPASRRVPGVAPIIGRCCTTSGASRYLGSQRAAETAHDFP